MLEQFRKSLLRELDYRQEASNLTTIGEHLKEFEHIIVPEPISDYSTSRVLTMQYVHGKKITDLSSLARMEFDGNALAIVVWVAIVVVGLTLFFRFTDIGIATRATAENADRAALLGVPIRRVSTVSCSLRMAASGAHSLSRL